MKVKEIQFKKKREISDILSDSVEFIRQEIKPIARLVAFYVLPFIVLYGFVLVYLQKNVISKIDFTDQEALLANIGPVYLNILLFTLFGIFVQSLSIGTYYTYIDACIKKGKGNFSLSDISPHLFSNGLLAIVASIVMFIIVMLGLVLCIVPGIYFANTLSLVFFALIFEKKGLGHALSRSVFLVNKQWWGTFLLNLCGIVIIWAAGFIMSVPAMIAGLGASIFSSNTPPVELPNWYWVISGVSTVVTSVLWIIPYTFLAFQYFSIEEMTKEIQPPYIS